jgi:predicted ester cyclase
MAHDSSPYAPGATNVETIRTAVRRYNAHDLDGYMQAFATGCMRGAPGSPNMLSLPEIRAGLELVMAAVEDVRLDEVMLFGEGTHVCAWWRMVGTHTGEFLGAAPTGRSIAVDNAEIYEFDADGSGLVVKSWSFGDPQALLVELGVVPTDVGESR